MAEAPGMDKTLTPDDAVKIFEELLPAHNRSYVLGLKLNLPLSEVEFIHSQYEYPQDRLLHVIIAFLMQMEPRPTWRVIVKALRSRAINLPDLARRVEVAHIPDPTDIPDPTATRDVVPETATVLTPADAVMILDELFEARNQSYVLGLALKLPLSEVEAIHSQYQNPQDRLLHVIIAFLEQAEPRPTWRVIVEALRSHVVNLPTLARRVEKVYCPDSITTHSGPGPIATPSDLKSSQLSSTVVLQTPIQKAPQECHPIKESKIKSEAVTSSTETTINQSSVANIRFAAKDFFCPVTTGLLLQPHLTSCCGNHLSQEAASRIQREGGACPLCNVQNWSTVLNKHFQRQVYSLRVFCRHEDRGCSWQGELAALDRHVTSCSMKDVPQVATLHANEDNKIIVAGVHILGKQCFWYTGKEMEFIWEEAGISLHFPAARCERDIKISVGIFTDLEQNYIIPQQYKLMPRASSTYEINASAPLPAPVRVRIEHCAIVEKEKSLVHMVAHGDAPYKFKPLHGGHFPLNKSYGEIEMEEFSLLTIIYNIMDIKMMLAVFVFHLKNNTIHFLVTKNTPANCIAVRNEYRNASSLQSHTMRYFYRTTEISLSIRELSPGCDGWIIEPSCKPAVVDMLGVHTYEPGSVIPKIELKLKWQGTGELKEEEVEIGVQGGSMESFTLSCKPENPEKSAPVLPQPQNQSSPQQQNQSLPQPQNQSSPQQQNQSSPQQQNQSLPQPQNQSSPQQHSASTSPLQQPTDRPTLPLLHRFPTKSGDPINIIERIGTAYRKLGVNLLEDEYGSLTDTIEATHRSDPIRITETILQKWLKKQKQSWSELIAALRKIEHGALANDLEKNLIH